MNGIILLVLLVTSWLTSQNNIALSLDWYLPQISIPSLNITAPMTRFYLGAETWDIPEWESRVGHLERTPWITEDGNIVLAGHSEYPGGSDGVFATLPKIEPDTLIILTMGHFNRTFKVREIKYVALDDLTPIYPSNTNQITLITCDVVSYNPSIADYDKRLIVIAEEVEQ